MSRNFVRAGLVLCFSGVFLYLTTPIYSIDFWWHLATGRWIWENGSLPHADPFGFLTFESDSALWRDFTLKQSWLSQLAFYGAYLAGGFHGVVLLSGGAYTAMCLALYLLMRQAGAQRPLALGLMAYAIVTVVMEFAYVEARPQMWTMLFSVAAIQALECLKEGKGWPRWGLPALMLLWANLHAGYMVGALYIAIYSGAALLNWERPPVRTGTRGFYFTALLSVLIAGINPSGFDAYLVIAGTIGEGDLARYWSNVMEAGSIFGHTAALKAVAGLPYLDGLVILTVLGVALGARHWRRMPIEHVLILALTLAMGVKSVRYVVFFIQAAMLVTAGNLGRAWEGNRLFSRPRFKPHAQAWATASVALLLAMGFAYAGWQKTGLRMDKPYATDYEGTVRFIRESGLGGNVFNDYTHAGRLIWWLGPEVGVFVDERGLSLKGFDLFSRLSRDPYETGDSGGAGGRGGAGLPLYERVSRAYGISMAILPGADPISGVTLPLAYALIRDEHWQIVYADDALIVFMKLLPENLRFISTHMRPRADAYANILALARRAAAGGHGSEVSAHLSMGIAYLGLGEREKALAHVLEFLRLRPGDKNGLYFRSLIEGSAPGPMPDRNRTGNSIENRG